MGVQVHCEAMMHDVSQNRYLVIEKADDWTVTPAKGMYHKDALSDSFRSGMWEVGLVEVGRSGVAVVLDGPPIPDEEWARFVAHVQGSEWRIVKKWKT